MGQATYTPVRAPCPTEGRLIARHDHRFYNNLLVAGIYNVQATTGTAPEFDLLSVERYAAALQACLEEHAPLSTVVRKGSDGKRVFARVSHVNIEEHFHCIDPALIPKSASDHNHEDELAARIIQHLSNDPDLTFFESFETRPPWRLDLLPLEQAGHTRRILICFSYSHVLGDGMSGISFHKTFLRALQTSFPKLTGTSKLTFTPPPADLPVLPKLPVSLVYLLAPALGHYLPTFITKLLNLKPSVSGADPHTWHGPPNFLNNPASTPPVLTATEILSIPSNILDKTLQSCRTHNTKFTPFLQECIAQCFSRHLPTYTPATQLSQKSNFISCTPTNIRTTANIPQDTFGIFASAGYSRHEIDRTVTPDSSIEVTEGMWSAAARNYEEISRGAGTLQDQPVGLLAWVGDLDGWMAGQIGSGKDTSWEVSNIMAFDGKGRNCGGEVEAAEVSVEKMYFSQPGNAVGSAVDFNVVSVVGGELVVCAAWQVGALGLDEREGLGVEEVERELLRRVMEDLRRFLDVAAGE